MPRDVLTARRLVAQIMQGRITKVLNMKPQEILGLIEEAAGTRMYEVKKANAIKTVPLMAVSTEVGDFPPDKLAGFKDIMPKLPRVPNEL